MAFVPITAGQLTLRGERTGQIINLPFTKATAVGYVTFTQDGQTFFNLPAYDNFRIVDGYIGDNVNATDYIDIFLDSIVKTQARIWVDGVQNATTVPRLAPSSLMKGGSQFSLYYYSA